MTNKNAYAQSGVDVEAGYEVVERIKKHVARTERAGVMGALGGFGGMFDLSKTGSLTPVFERSNMPPKPPRAPMTPARSVRATCFLIRSTTS